MNPRICLLLCAMAMPSIAFAQEFEWRRLEPWKSPPARDGHAMAFHSAKMRTVLFSPSVEAILAGEIHGTVSQQPYYYGYESIRILNALHEGDESVLPEGEQLKVDYKIFRQDNAQELLDLLDDVLGKK